MISLLNFSHPLTDEQLVQVAKLINQVPTVRDVTVQIDRSLPITEVARDVAESVGLSGVEWQTLPLLINPPGLAPLALALIAEVHGRCGYFPPIINIRPVVDAVPPRFEVAEIINLQTVRDQARSKRSTD